MSRKAEVDAAVADLDFENKKYQVQLETSMGDLHLDLNPEKAPGHCRNLIGLAKIGYYEGLVFHRIIPGFMIQGGCPDGNGMGGPGYKVDAEFNDTAHVEGTLSMARSSDPNSAGSQFFVCLDATDYLDGQYTAFGQATPKSLEVLKAIGAVKTDGNDRPLEDVTIKKVTVVES